MMSTTTIATREWVGTSLSEAGNAHALQALDHVGPTGTPQRSRKLYTNRIKTTSTSQATLLRLSNAKREETE